MPRLSDSRNTFRIHERLIIASRRFPDPVSVTMRERYEMVPISCVTSSKSAVGLAFEKHPASVSPKNWNMGVF